MTSIARELIRIMPKRLSVGLIILFVAAIPALVMLVPAAAFAIGAFLWMVCVHAIINLPAIANMESFLYSQTADFIGFKIRTIFHLWAVGAALLFALYIIFIYAFGMDPEIIMPQIGLIDMLVLFMVSVIPFVAVTFLLTIASYTCNKQNMGIVSMTFVISLFIVIIVPVLWLASSESYVPWMPEFNIFPHMLLGLFVTTASLLLSVLLSKKAKESFKKYVELPP